MDEFCDKASKNHIFIEECTNFMRPKSVINKGGSINTKMKI